MLLKITAHTPIGKFEGVFNKNTDATTEDLITARDRYQRHADFIVIYPDVNNWNTEITLREAVINASVLVWTITDNDGNTVDLSDKI